MSLYVLHKNEFFGIYSPRFEGSIVIQTHFTSLFYRVSKIYPILIGPTYTAATAPEEVPRKLDLLNVGL